MHLPIDMGTRGALLLGLVMLTVGIAFFRINRAKLCALRRSPKVQTGSRSGWALKLFTPPTGEARLEQNILGYATMATIGALIAGAALYEEVWR